ncbi:heme lyase CcmF/NrfE family subunit [Gynuella sunshinyii]|uniref:Cytochrome c biogenesis factor n=1 Tax=Gynuella sunshinyii YC6258 TaxID=1445510 RepID=A0A0C5VR57_9GAMM|nr:heme lyase CcmF/NrfE family subunit [Gynuella sunshinyii]AJQ96721.1 cytochrome c biogenesis factor [Gynuella sunshinyii YC6258]
MIPEFGLFCLILALGLSFLLSTIPAWGYFKNNVWMMMSSRMLATGVFVMLAFAFGLLAYAMATDDFSVSYVASNSNSALPIYYKISAIWGGHEGSMLLWVLILSGWTLAVSAFSRSLPTDMLALVMSMLGVITLGFLIFVVLTSSPFDRVLPMPPADGRDLNPLLQDIGLILHPPMLYMGYVGFSVAFVFAIAALVSGQLDAAWAKWARPWTNVAWIFLTLGIALGSWWAYYELGWGGWWFWDPVENASFMPWLVGTALIHSLAVTEKRGAFKSWTVLLAIFAFSFSLLGTFLVRSGVLTSVHAFASDPKRGYFILTLLAIAIGGSLLLFALRAPSLRSFTYFKMMSRESFLFFNNILLAVAAFGVMLGTLLPLIFDVFQLGKISVGPPIFNTVFNTLMIVLLALLGVGQLLKWKSDNLAHTLKFQLISAPVSVVLAVLAVYVYAGSIVWPVVLGLSLVFWIISSVVISVRHNIRHASSFAAGLIKMNLSYYGMLIAHLGVVVTVVGVVMVANFQVEHDVRMSIGQEKSFSGYDFKFNGTEQVQGPNYLAERGSIDVSRDGRLIVVLHPEKRQYLAAGSIMTEADIQPGLTRDLYVALGEQLNDSGDWALRIHVKPFVRWIWFGALFMAFGGLLGMLDKRYRKTALKEIDKASAKQEAMA